MISGVKGTWSRDGRIIALLSSRKGVSDSSGKHVNSETSLSLSDLRRRDCRMQRHITWKTVTGKTKTFKLSSSCRKCTIFQETVVSISQEEKEECWGSRRHCESGFLEIAYEAEWKQVWERNSDNNRTKSCLLANLSIQKREISSCILLSLPAHTGESVVFYKFSLVLKKNNTYTYKKKNHA